MKWHCYYIAICDIYLLYEAASQCFPVLLIDYFFSLDDIWPLYSWTLPLLPSAFRTGYFSIIFSTTFGLSTLKILDAAAACRHIYLFLRCAINWTGGSATIKGQSRQRTRVITKYNCCKYKDTERFQIQLLQIQRHIEISKRTVANTKTHRNTKYRRCKCKETQNLQLQLLQRHNKNHAQPISSALFENIKQQEL